MTEEAFRKISIITYSKYIPNSLVVNSSFSFHLFLVNHFNAKNYSSIGLKSGEYGGKYISFTPALSHIRRILSI